MITNQHLVLGAITNFTVSNFPAPMETLPAVLVGVICLICAIVLSLRECNDTEDAAKNE